MMNVFQEIEDIRRHRWKEPHQSWGVVPTMGFLHEGHLSLVRRARQENDRVGVSIFVNPIQFNNPQDLKNYPVDLERDLTLLRAEGVDLVWTPAPEVVYPPGFQTYVEVEQAAQPLEGEHRPGHFRGVATVVAKIFNVFQPHRAYFGQKDAQQAVVVQRMVKDLNFNLEIVVCPTVREPDGLAMSSRNARLSSEGRKRALCLYQALRTAQQAISAGERDAEQLRELMRRVIQQTPGAEIDYVSVADPLTLKELEQISRQALLSLAVLIEGVRLIDNVLIR